MTEVLDRMPETETQPMTSMDGLHGRLVLANQTYLDPEKFVPQEEVTHTTDINHRNYHPFENASVHNRRSFWQEQVEKGGVAADFESQLEKWTTRISETFSDQNNAEILSTFDPLFRAIGIDRSQTNGIFTKQHAQRLYDLYFKNKDASAVKLFVSHILNLNIQQNNGAINYDRIQQQSKNIRWFAHIFGDEAAEMVEHLILAETRLCQDQNFTFKAVRKDDEGHDVSAINKLSDDEKRILRFILENNQGTADIIPSQDSEKKKNEYPILKHKDSIQEKIRNNDNVIIVGHTGSGKTFSTALFIYEMLGPGEKLIVTELIVTEPRQINTQQLANDIATSQGLKLGEEIGYIHGDSKENYDPKKTKALFATEGTILKQLMNDPLLKGTNYIMIDEIHVRSKATEQLLLFLKDAQKLRKQRGLPPLKIIAVSATVDKEELKRYFDNAVEEEIEGQKHHIEPHHPTEPIDDKNMPQKAAEIVKDIIANNKPGDIAIAVAGKKDRDAHVRAIRALNPDVRIIEIHRNSTQKEKNEVERAPLPGEPRRVIIGTDAIQTGVTIKNLKYLINTGYVNQTQFDPLSGLTFLEKVKQSQAEIDQWKGRVGRKSPGDAYFLFTEDDYNSRQKYPTPEMQRSDLSDVLLNLKSRGKSFNDVDFLSSKKIDPLHIQAAEETLQKLGALDRSKNITLIGREMARLPTDLHLARMITEAKNQGIAQEACIIAALSEQIENLFPNGIVPPALKGLKDTSSDFLSYLNLWKAYEESGKSIDWITKNGADPASLEKIERKLEKLYRSAGIITPQPLGIIDKDKLGRAIAQGFADRVLHFVPGKGYVWELNNACNYSMNIDRKSALSGTQHEYIVFGKNSNKMIDRVTGKATVYVSLAHTIQPEWLN